MQHGVLATCKMYHHAPVTSRGGVESQEWFAMECASPAGDKGWSTIVRIGQSDSDVFTLKPRGLDISKKYKVAFDGLDNTIDIEGFDLIRDGISV